ncbi:MAG: TetR/AcrR family transcriptional regulator [Alphaproteobacteria bacterium]|nr:TetR/AcrR family transcriptional regulator [Alphaproteobacteria bacterium]
MPRKSDRRTPSQRRAKESVDAIVEACAQVLVQHGWEATTTNHIAERAGVSVGTLYQYFANREAVLEAVRDRVMQEQLAAVAEVSSQVLQTRPDFDDAIERLVDTVFAVVGVRPGLVRILILDAPSPDFLQIDRIWKERMIQLVRAALYSGTDRIRPGNVDLMATLLVGAIWGVMRDVVAHRPDLLQAPDLRREIHLLVARFLEP